MNTIQETIVKQADALAVGDILKGIDHTTHLVVSIVRGRDLVKGHGLSVETQERFHNSDNEPSLFSKKTYTFFKPGEKIHTLVQ